jgi:hypothetical protein
MVIATLEEFNDMNSMEVVRCQRSEYEECGSPARSGLGGRTRHTGGLRDRDSPISLWQISWRDTETRVVADVTEMLV